MTFSVVKFGMKTGNIEMACSSLLMTMVKCSTQKCLLAGLFLTGCVVAVINITISIAASSQACRLPGCIDRINIDLERFIKIPPPPIPPAGDRRKCSLAGCRDRISIDVESNNKIPSPLHGVMHATIRYAGFGGYRRVVGETMISKTFDFNFTCHKTTEMTRKHWWCPRPVDVALFDIDVPPPFAVDIMLWTTPAATTQEKSNTTLFDDTVLLKRRQYFEPNGPGCGFCTTAVGEIGLGSNWYSLMASRWFQSWVDCEGGHGWSCEGDVGSASSTFYGGEEEEGVPV